MKKLLFLTLFLSILNISFSQKTYVRGYYRKDGTYVRPHTRGYKAGTTSSTGYYTEYIKEKSKDETYNLVESHLSFVSFSTDQNQIKSEIKELSRFTHPIKVTPTGLSFSMDSDSSDASHQIYVSVIRYKDKVVDICPIARSILTRDYDFEYGSVYHRIPRGSISAEDIVELVSKGGFELKDDFLTYSISLGSSFDYSVKVFKKYPFLKHSIEVLKLK